MSSNYWKYSTYSKVDSQVKKNFPLKKPREHQLETISEIKEAIDKGYKYIVLEAGTGTGKSVIAATLASLYDSSYILTVTKQLQDQYLKDFGKLGFKLVKGRANFKCKKYAEDSLELGCDEGRCILEGYSCDYSKRNKPGVCDYFYQKWQALNSDVVISNYHYMFLELNYNQDFKKRNLMICDEAHNLESTIMNQLKLEFTRKELKEYVGINLSKSLADELQNGDYNDWIQFINRITDIYRKELNRIKNIKKKKIKEKVYFLKNRLNECYHFINHIKNNPDMWICDYNGRFGIIEFKPLKVDRYAKNTLFSYADVCLFMSATILDYKLFAKWLGINENEVYAIRRKSPFKVNRNPIKTYDDFNLAYKYLNLNAPKTIPTIKEILEIHKNDKGIIHTVSHNCKKFLKKELDNDRLIDHKTSDRAEKLEKYKKSKEPLVLISPSMNEGVDLPGNLCRFQIIFKIPFPSLANKQIENRKNMEPEWYGYKTALALVQTYGRGMRYKDDYCKTYFIDSRLKKYIRDDELSNKFLPDFFKDAIDITPADIRMHDIPDDGPEISTSTTPVDAPEISISLTPEEKINLKHSLIKQGEYLKRNNSEDALLFYKELLSHEFFANDYYPYKMMSKICKENQYYSDEADIIIRFFKSGIYCDERQFRWFKRRLKQLSKKNYFDFSQMPSLEEEFNHNGNLNKDNIDTPVLCSEKIISSTSIDETVSDVSDTLKSQEDIKYDLIVEGNKLINDKNYGKAIDFHKHLLNHELFINDYYLYKILSKLYHYNNQFGDEVNIIKSFFKSGIYCNEKQFRWFIRRLKKLSRDNYFDFTEISELKEQFKNNGALNKHLSDLPVPTAVKIKNMHK